MSDAVARLNDALEGRYRIERTMEEDYRLAYPQISPNGESELIVIQNWRALLDEGR